MGRGRSGTIRLGFVLGSVVIMGCGAGQAAPAASPPKTAPAPGVVPASLAAARQALEATDYAKAEPMLRDLLRCSPGPSCSSAAATREFARLLLETGRAAEVMTLALKPDDGVPEALLLAQARRYRGELDEALAALEAAPSVAPGPSVGSASSGGSASSVGSGSSAALVDALALWVLRAEILLERGERGPAETLLLERVIPAYGDGSLERMPADLRGRALTQIGRAAHLLRSPKDANEAYNQAEELGAESAELLLDRAELFIEKYDNAHGAEVLTELLKRAPQHARALILMARLLLEERLAFDEARRYIERAQKVAPDHPDARFVLASMALRDLDFPEVDAQLQAGLKQNPRHLELLSLLAATRFLAEDQAGFEQTLERVLSLSPGYAHALSIIADHAEWEHRYEEMETLLRRAVRLDPEDGRARGLLGLTLVRAGSDSAGVVELRRAFADDPFNVRVKNTLQLYEEVIPQHYSEERHGPFVLRVPRRDRDLLLRYVPALLDQAYAAMRERYGYEPRAPLSIEIYADREQFAVRTSGLPDTPIQGVCFGRKLATISPSGSPGNLGMTLWHELAHVFHIGLSQSRVPRWLTEGLAEWETEHLHRGWSRELDLHLYQAKHEDHLPHLDQMTQAFTHAQRMEDVGTAYYASGRIAGFLVATRGEEKVARLLAALGDKKPAEVALPLALGVPTAQLDEEFRTFLAHDLARYDGQFVSQMTRLSVEEARRVAERTQTPQAQTASAQAVLLQGKVRDAEQRLRKLSALDPQAAYTLARIELGQGKKEDALARLESDLFSRQVDGVEPRLLAAKVLVGDRRFADARAHLEKATTFDPSGEEVWALLASVGRALDDAELELRAVRAWARRSEHDGEVHRRLLELLLETGQVQEAALAAKDAVWTDLASAATHALVARVSEEAGDHRSADFEWESALLCQSRPDEQQRIRHAYAEALDRRGLHQRAREVRASRPAN